MAILTVAQARDYAAQAGFTGLNLDVCVAVAQAESGLDTLAINTANNAPPSRDRGLMQLNDYWHPEVSDAQAFDPLGAMQAAYVISGGDDFTPWSAFKNGAYLPFLLGGDVATLPNFPFVNQLDGSENDDMNCVPASLAATLRYLTGKLVTPDQLKDAEYGATYTGGTSFARYHDDNSDLMVNTYECDAEAFTAGGNPGALVAKVHEWLRAGYPVIATIPSAWATVFPLAQRDAGSLPTHVVAFYSEEGGLTAMNPWGAKKHTGSDQYWSDRLCFKQVWRVYKISGGTPVLDISAVSSYFSATADGQWLCSATKQRIRGAVLTFYRTLGPPNNLPYIGLPKSEEQAYGASPSTYQVYERGILIYDPNHVHGSQPGCGVVYLAFVDSVSTNPTLRAAMDAAYAAVDALDKARSDLAQADAALAAARSDRDAALAAKAAAEALMQPLKDAADAALAAARDALAAKDQADADLAALQTADAKALALLAALRDALAA